MFRGEDLIVWICKEPGIRHARFASVRVTLMVGKGVYREEIGDYVYI